MERMVAPKGVDARQRLRVRPWQRTLIDGVFTDPRPRAALWAMPMGWSDSRYDIDAVLVAINLFSEMVGFRFVGG